MGNSKTNNTDANTLVTETKTLVKDPHQTQTIATGETSTKNTQSIEVDKKGVPHKDDLKIEIPAFIVNRKPRFKVTYSAKAEATPFTFFRIFVSLAIFAMVLGVYFQQKKQHSMTKNSKLQSLGRLSDLGRKIGFLPPLIDEDPSATLNVIKLDPNLKGLKITLNGQEVKIGKNFELYAPVKTELNIQLAAEGIRPHIVQLQFDKPIPYQLKPKYYPMSTGTLNLSTDKDVDIVLYLEGDVLIEKSSPITEWPLPAGKYHALLENDFLKIKKSIDFEISANAITNITEVLSTEN